MRRGAGITFRREIAARAGEPTAHPEATDPRKTIDEQPAVQMIHLVLQADREQALDRPFVGDAAAVHAAYR